MQTEAKSGNVCSGFIANAHTRKTGSMLKLVATSESFVFVGGKGAPQCRWDHSPHKTRQPGCIYALGFRPSLACSKPLSNLLVGRREHVYSCLLRPWIGTKSSRSVLLSLPVSAQALLGSPPPHPGIVISSSSAPRVAGNTRCPPALGGSA